MPVKFFPAFSERVRLSRAASVWPASACAIPRWNSDTGELGILERAV